ncbi:MAG: hypothetical protein U5K73_10840 [Halofilum sp. (in: g-proteobacteria)]|nr:hypothetical protein [Halofilum sp. (in: g-proteobacteria)]
MAIALLLNAVLGLAACSDGGWSGTWSVAEVSTPLTGANRNPLRDAMVGRSVELSRDRIVLPHYTDKTKRMIVPIERVEPDEQAAEIVLHPAENEYVTSSLILNRKADDILILHGVPKNGPSANFFLRLERK